MLFMEFYLVESYENLTECAPCVWYSHVDKKCLVKIRFSRF